MGFLGQNIDLEVRIVVKVASKVNLPLDIPS